MQRIASQPRTNHHATTTLRLLSRPLVVLGLLLASLAARAATYTWTGAGFNGDTDYKWSNPWNWQGLVAPHAGELGVALVFPNTAAPRSTTNDVLNLGISSVTFLGSNYGIHGGSNGVTMTLVGANGGSFAVVAAGDNCQFGLSTRLHLGSTGSVAVAGGSTLSIRSRISGVFGFSKLSPGTLNLQGAIANTFTGTATVLGGNLDLRNAGTALPGGLVIGDGDSASAPAARLYLDDQISDTSPVTVNANGKFLLNGHDEAIGSLTLAGGWVDSGAGTLTLNGNVLVLDPDPAPGLSDPSVIKGRLNLGFLGRTFDCADEESELNVSASIRGGYFGAIGAGVTKSGPGWMNLSASNSYPGATFVTGGTLVADDRHALGATNGYTSVGSNAVLQLFLSDLHTNTPAIAGERLVLYGGSQVYPVHDCDWDGPVELPGGQAVFNLDDAYADAPIFRIEGVISGTGGFDKKGPGGLWLAGSEDNTYTGRTYVANGKLGLYQGGFLFNRVSVPGPLVVGHFVNNPVPGPVVEVWKDETITGGSAVVNIGSQLLLKGVTQTFNTLAVNGGVADSGPTGLFKLTGAINSTNAFPGGEIRGHLDLGDAPRSIRVENYILRMAASVSGGPNATLEVLGATHSRLHLETSNSYSGLTLIRGAGVMVEHAYALGPAGSGVIVTNTGTLSLSGNLSTNNGENFTITKAFLHLNAFSPDISYTTLSCVGSNVWKGPVWLGTNASITPYGVLTILGPISGPGGLTVEGPGELVLAGVGAPNSYAGPTLVHGATLTLARSAGLLASLAVPGDVTVTGYYDDFLGWLFGRLRLAANSQVPASARVSVDPDCVLESAAHATNTLASFTGGGDVVFGPRSLLRAGFDNLNFQFSGRFMGGDPSAPDTVLFEKHGLGVLALGGVNTLTGAVDVVQGNLWVAGSLPSALAIARAGAMLGGPGDVGLVRVDGGTFWPGGGQGDMLVRSCTGGIPGLHPYGTLKLNLHGPTAAEGVDCLQIENLADLENLRLEFNPGAFNVPVGAQFLVISNKSAGPILGRLNHPVTGQNLNEGDAFYAGSKRFSISYIGGNGNDVVLRRVADPVPADIGGVTPEPDGMMLNLSGEPGVVYRVEANFDLKNPGGWTQIGTVTIDDAGFANFIDGDAQQYPMRFYRLVTP